MMPEAAAERQTMRVGWNAGLGGPGLPRVGSASPTQSLEGFPFPATPGIPAALMELSLLLQHPAWSESLALPGPREGGPVCSVSPPLRH